MSVSQSELRKRVPISLNSRLDHQLLGYSVAATAASVGLLALPTQAQIVYTATNQTIPPGGSLDLDLNNDGITDFTIADSVSYNCLGPDCVFQQLFITPTAPNGVVGYNNYANGLPILAKVGPGLALITSFAKMDRCKATRTSAYLSGSFQRGSHYLGLAFSINGQIHYGWARFRVTVEWRCNAHILLTGYAYETIPGEPIRAGETVNHKISATDRTSASLGVLALGSVGLEAWRRDDDASGNPSGRP